MRIEDCLISLTVCADHDSSHTHHHNVYSLLKSFLELKRQENKNPQKPQKIGDILLKGVKTCFMHRTLAHLLLSKSSKSFPPSEPSSQLFSCSRGAAVPYVPKIQALSGWVGGGGQPNLVNAWILGTYGMAAPPLQQGDYHSCDN